MDIPNEYVSAALAMGNYLRKHNVFFEAPDAEIDAARHDFQGRFSPKRLKSLSDSELLDTIFYSADSNNQSLCYHLEFSKINRRYFGSIAGGSAYKFGLFQRQQDNNWMTGSPQNPLVLSTDEALKLGKQIRDSLLTGFAIIADSPAETVEDYEALQAHLNSELGQYVSYAWFQKYYSMFFPEKLVGWFSSDWVRHYLYGLGITPKDNFYTLNGQLAIVQRIVGLPSAHFRELCERIFGGLRRFYRLGSSDGATRFAEDWRSKGMVAIGWNELSDLIDFLRNSALDRSSIATRMESIFYNGDNKTASRKAGEVKTFYETKPDDVFVVAEGERLIGFVDNLSSYYYDPDEPMSHCKKGTWRTVFNEIDRLPVPEGLQTTCVAVKKPENIIYLYSKYYGLYEEVAPPASETDRPQKEENHPEQIKELPMRLPRKSTKHPLNAILYGAPGTGKTYSTTEYAMAIINDADIRETALTPEERKALVLAYKSRVKSGQIVFTTFHQSYGYEDFIQGLRPVPDSEPMKLANIDGVFKRVANRAMRDNENNYVIIIDEINRANISKVFGELITLIETDKRWGEENELCATLPSGATFAIPNNLYIVGTMNSADKSISLIDTALRRRFDFVEISPNADLVGNEVLRRVLEKLNEELLNELDSTDLLIGHAYFIGKTEGDLIGIINRNIIPLLYEYFFDNSKKVKAVVNKAIEELPYRIEDEKVGRIRIAEKT